MVTLTRRSMLLGSAAVVAGCAAPTKFRTYTGPEVTAIVAYKETRTIVLMSDDRVLGAYPFELGFAPDGQKQQEGDGRTPEGQYWIDRRNPNSRYHLSIGISYPNSTDRARARVMNVPPGGDIFIHGTPTNFLGVTDWTVGCLAVTNPEIEAIYSMVRDGTPIWIVANPNSVLVQPTEQARLIGETMDEPASDQGPAMSFVDETVMNEVLPQAAPSQVTAVQSAPVQSGAALRPQIRPAG